MGVDNILVPWVASGVALILVGLKLALILGAGEVMSRVLGGSPLAVAGDWTRVRQTVPEARGDIDSAGPLATQLSESARHLTLIQAGETFSLTLEGRATESFGTDVAPISRAVEGGPRVTASAEWIAPNMLVLSLESLEGHRFVRTFRIGDSLDRMEEEVQVAGPGGELVAVERYNLTRA